MPHDLLPCYSVLWPALTTMLTLLIALATMLVFRWPTQTMSTSGESLVLPVAYFVAASGTGHIINSHYDDNRLVDYKLSLFLQLLLSMSDLLMLQL